MNAEESNKLIAEFMGVGWKYGKISKYEKLVKYRISWDWLMPVVEKIESIYNEHHGYFGVYISSNSCTIQGTKLHLSLKDSKYGGVYFNEMTLNSKLESTYSAVVKFIQWYNLNKQK